MLGDCEPVGVTPLGVPAAGRGFASTLLERERQAGRADEHTFITARCLAGGVVFEATDEAPAIAQGHLDTRSGAVLELLVEEIILRRT